MLLQNMLCRSRIGKLNIKTFRFCSTTNAVPLNSIDVNKKSFLQKWTSFWKALFADYKDVLVDSANHAKKHPFKSVTWLSFFGFCASCSILNPDESSYREAVIEKSNELIFVGKPIRNPNAEEYLRRVESYYNGEQIHRLSFALFSIIIRNFKSNGSGLYKDNCSYVQPTYSEIISERIIDVGFWNKWWIMERNMKDFDINPNEWNMNKV